MMKNRMRRQRLLILSVGIGLLFLPGDAVAARQNQDPMSGTVKMVLDRLRASGLCSYRRSPGQGVTLCNVAASNVVAIHARPERLDAKFEAIITYLTVESTDSRVPRGEVRRSSRIAVRLIRELFPHWANGERWITSALIKARASECIIVTRVGDYAVSVTGVKAGDFNVTNADLVIARNDVASRYQTDYCK